MKRTTQITPEQAEAIRRQLAAGVDPASIVVTRTKPGRSAGEPNKGEAAFGQHLEFEKQQGRILWYWFEQIKLKIGKKCWLTIDYVVVRADFRVELIDVKGRKGDGYYCREDAKVKLRAIADKFPVFKVAVVWPRKGGGWSREDFS
jgi:hypothetical protein